MYLPRTSLTHGPALPPAHGRTLVTGASSGIGWACAEALLDAGRHVIGTSRSGSHSPHPPGVEMIPLDMGDPESIAQAATELLAEGPISVIVANAGESQSGPAEELPAEALARLFQVNVLGQIDLIERLLPDMRALKRGRVILIGSMLGGLSLPYRASYVSTKAAIRRFGLALRGEVAQFGIGVTVVEPGSINTGISAEDVAATVLKEITTERPVPLVARGSRAQLAVPLQRLIPTQTMLTIMRFVHRLR